MISLLLRFLQDQLIYDSMTSKASSIEIAGFTKNRPVVLFIHDFTSNGYTGWIKVRRV